MDEFKDFFKEIKERATSPFFGSFIISWCLINWPILIAVLFKNNEKKIDRFTFVYYTIVKHDNLFSFFVFPFICAIAYTIFYPWIRRKIKVHIAKQQAFGDSEILKKTGIASVSLENYLVMLEAHNTSQLTLSELISDQQNIQAETEKLRTQLNEAKVSILTLNQKISELTASNHKITNFGKLSHYTGFWFIYKNGIRLSGDTWRINETAIKFSNDDAVRTITSFSSDYQQRRIILQVSKKINKPTTPTRSMTIGVDKGTDNEEQLIEDIYIFEVSDNLQTLTLVPSDSSKGFSLIKHIP